jgi:holo-[acyl-carrier protein] synthase
VIVGLGMDVVEIARVRRILEGPAARAERFLARCFTGRERAFCDAAQDRPARYAARLAAKEAAAKALATPAGMGWRDAEVVRGAGPPALELHGAAQDAARALGVARALLTLTHDGGIAAAAVVLEGNGR